MAAWRGAGLIDDASLEALGAAFVTADRSAVAWQGADGRHREMTVIAVPGGGHLALCRDSTEAKAGAARLAEERAGIARLLTNMRDCVVLMDPQGVILHNSSVTGELLGLPAALVRPGATHQDFLRYFYRRGDFGTDVPEDDFIADRRARILAAGNLTYPSRMPDGTWVEYNFQKLEDEHLLVTVRDITALKQRELELERERAEAAEQRDRLDTLLAHLQDFVVLFDENDRVLVAADTGALMGLAPERIAPGQRLHDVIVDLIERGDLGPPPPRLLTPGPARTVSLPWPASIRSPSSVVADRPPEDPPAAARRIKSSADVPMMLSVVPHAAFTPSRQSRRQDDRSRFKNHESAQLREYTKACGTSAPDVPDAAAWQLKTRMAF